MVIKLGGTLSWAQMQEIRDGVRAFAKTGKPVIGWAESFGESNGKNTADYVLATACTELWLQPTGELGLLGVAAETTFLRGALDKLGVEPQFGQRYEYKNAADRITQTEFTPAHHEAVDRIVESIWEHAVEQIADARGIDADAVRRLADSAPLLASDALDAGLIDRLGYRDEVYAEAKRRAGADAQLLFADQWTPRRKKAAALIRRSRDFVAVVEGHGAIVVGRSKSTPQGRQMGSDTVSAAFRAARRNDHAAAVLFRIDSPGGSAVASDTIWREVRLTRDAGKPVIVAMGTVAGSGGYYVSCPADVIVAEPATITGSIGVLSGKLVADNLLERLGLTTGAVARGEHARMFSSRRGFSDSERERLDAMLDRIYRDFVQKVADGRDMSYDGVHEIARGRIWSGVDALHNGLVDVLGGQRDAADIARQRAGLRPDAPLRPALHVSPVLRLGRAKSSEDPRALAATGTDWGELGKLAAALGLPAAGPLQMPAVRLG
jgi:protease-4